MSASVAVVGAGFAGLACARRLASERVPVVLVDKGRRAGGRASTRLHAGPFDHGAQFFTAEDPTFRETLRGWLDLGWVEPWRARFAEIEHGGVAPDPRATPRYVGVPTMGQLPIEIAASLAPGVAQCLEVPVVRLAGGPGAWTLVDERGAHHGPHHAVVVAVPAPQAAPLLAPSPELAARAADAVLAPCWALMLRFATAVDLGFDAARVADRDLSWIARDGSKPGRPDASRFVVHASADFSRTHLEANREVVEAALLDAFARVTGHDATPVEWRAHRWRYARVERAVGTPCGWDADRLLGSCGDWWIEARVEAAWASGIALAEHVLTTRR